MQTYIVLLRGVNVGGKNRVPMNELKQSLLELGYVDVVTYIASGNIVLKSKKKPPQVRAEIERLVPERFKLDEQIKALVLTRAELEAVVRNKPKGFGDNPATYHSDVLFMIDIDAREALAAFSPREGVDTVTAGEGVIYSARLSARRTQSRLNRIMSTPAYKSMTIRNWNTVTSLLALAVR